MLAEPPVSVPVWTGNAGRPTVQHIGWAPEDADEMEAGPSHRPPSPSCPAARCSVLLEVTGVRVSHGDHSLLWQMTCPGCGYSRVYPATAYGASL